MEELPVQTNKNESQLATLMHLIPFLGYFFPLVGNIIAPLVLWIIKKDESPLLNEHGKAVLNFQISWGIYMLVAALLCIILIGIPILIALVIAHFIFTLIGGLRAADGQLYKYPWAIKFV